VALPSILPGSRRHPLVRAPLHAVTCDCERTAGPHHLLATDVHERCAARCRRQPASTGARRSTATTCAESTVGHRHPVALRDACQPPPHVTLGLLQRFCLPAILLAHVEDASNKKRKEKENVEY